jgi:hypothetical protein
MFGTASLHVLSNHQKQERLIITAFNKNTMETVDELPKTNPIPTLRFSRGAPFPRPN